MSNTAAVNPRILTVWGRLSWPALTAAEAYAQSQQGMYPDKDETVARPNFMLVLTQGQFEKARDHFVNVFLPYCLEQFKAEGKKGKNALEAAEVKQLIDCVTGDLAAQTANTPFKAVHEKTLDLMPDAVACVKVIGKPGTDFVQVAKVMQESELKVPDPDQVTWPCIKPLEQTVHSFYPGCEVVVTTDTYAYHNGRHPGFSLGANTIIFRNNAPRFGGAVDIDLDEVLLD